LAAILGEDGGNDPGKKSEAADGCHPKKNSLNLLTVRSPDMLPVPHRYSMSDDDGHVHHGIFDTDAFVRPASEDKIVSGVGLRRAFWI
jgi:hypothetical protein